MEFSRIGEHTIKCVISEEEIYDLGYTMDENYEQWRAHPGIHEPDI